MKKEEKLPIRTAILIPLFNSEETILDLIKEINEFSLPILPIFVINDGSTDKSGAILEDITDKITLISHPQNRGKGATLRAGFSLLLENGFTHAITIDSDGEHLAKDIPLFLEKIKEHPKTLWIGARLHTQNGKSIPLIQKVVRYICNFWIRVYTGSTLKDSRSGFRAYPLAAIDGKSFKRTNFDFEQEVLLKLAWNKTDIKEIEISDSSVLEKTTIFKTRFLKELFQLISLHSNAFLQRFVNPFAGSEIPGDTIKEKIKNLIDKEFKSNLSPLKASSSLSVGVFFGLLPIYGFQVIVLLFFATFLKLNRPLSFVGSNISFPLFWPLIFTTAVWVGSKILGTSEVVVSSGGKIVSGFFQFVVGSLVLAPTVAVAVFLISYPLFLSIKKKS